MSRIEELDTYRVIEKRDIQEMNSRGWVLEHKKTGARLFLMENDDENKVFSIGFRTPPADSTGLPHILEHSVLCGSEKFPVKDPFVELVKGSLNTFLNAMTYPDKTVYPIASCNDKDFQNLMDVYMDAVLHPNIYREPKIFMQEGWHYEMESAEEDLTINGVVYNEMKGAFSSPEGVLDRVTRQVLFPDTSYTNESGGDPAVIPELTYEQFLDFHKTYYHPSNSYIYLYGNMDLAEKLEWLDKTYLCHYDRRGADTSIKLQAPFQKPVEKEIYYSITDGEPEDHAAYLSVNTVVGTDLDPKLYVAFQILEYTLIDAPGAPLKQALYDAGIGQDILGGYENGILQPYFSVIAKNVEADQKGEFLAVVKGTLRKLAEEGIDKKSLLAGLNYYEFRYREADYGSAPKGLMYGLWCMDSWLYDGDPMMHLCWQETFDFLKEAVNQGYFESLIREYLLDNPFEAVITVKPQRNLTAMEDAALAAKLAEKKAELSKEEIDSLVSQTRELKEYQETPSPQEELAKIPLLKREDIGTKAEAIYWDEKKESGVTVLHHNLFTAGIGYLQLLFDTKNVPEEDLPYVGILKSVLGYVDTEHYTYSDLTSEIYLNSGGIGISTNSYPNLDNPEKFTGVFTASVKVLYDKIGFGLEILEEILMRSKLEDEKRLGEILAETKSRARMKLENGSHSAAVARATSYFSPVSYFNDMTGGVGFYQFLEKLVKVYESEAEARKVLSAKLKDLAGTLFTKENLLVSYTADDDGYKLLPKSLEAFTGGLESASVLAGQAEKELAKKAADLFGTVRKFTGENDNEGFKTASQVNYVARCGSFKEKGLSYTGALRILKVILSYDYLWINLRAKGGAYGCMSGFGRSGEGYLVSYRDPNLAETNRIYEGIPAYLENFTIDERDMTKYVIGTISDVDTPLTPSIKGSRGLSAYLSDVTEEMLQKEREEILSATQEDIRALAPIVQAVLDTGSLCVIGNEEKVKAQETMFKEVKNLFGV